MKYCLIDNIIGETYHIKNKTAFHNLVIEKLLDYGRNKDGFVRLYEVTSECYMITKK